MPELLIRQAVTADIPAVIELWEEAREWLRVKGLDQWQYDVKTENIRKAVDEKSCWLVESPAGEPIATITLDENADPHFWTDDPDQALYAHRLVVRRSAAGHGLGSTILDWASEQARLSHKPLLRLDAWTNNPELHDYYRNLGFRLVGIVNDPLVVSGAFFERATA